MHLVEKITNPITATAFALGTAFASWTTAAQKIMEVISSILNFGKDFEYKGGGGGVIVDGNQPSR